MVVFRGQTVLIIVFLVLGIGVAVGYWLERTLDLVPKPSPTPQNLSVTIEKKSESPERDPDMVAGATFMVRVTEIKQQLEKNPNDLEAVIFMGNANYDITRFKEASEYYQRALELDANNLYVRTDLATSYFILGALFAGVSAFGPVERGKSNPKYCLQVYRQKNQNQ